MGNKKAEDIIEETMREYYEGLNNVAENKEEDAKSQTEEFDFLEVNLDEDDIEEDNEEDIEENIEEDDETETEKEYNKQMFKKKLYKIIGSIVAVVIVVYIGIALFFGSHFMFFTELNGEDVSMKSVKKIEELMAQQVDEYVLTIEESDGDKAQITGDSISAEYVPGEELKQLVKEQDNFLWITTLWNHPEITAKVGVKYNESALKAEIDKLDCLKKENQVKSVDAHPEFKDTKFEIVPEIVGTKIDREKFEKAIVDAVNGFQDTLNVFESGSYILPKFVSDSPEVIKAAEDMNKYLGAEITYDFNPHKEVVDAEKISKWVKVNKKMEVTFSKKEVKKYIESLAEKYNTVGKPRQFKTATGKTVKVTGGIYGWRIDQEKEYKKLVKDIKKAKKVTREPAYSSRAASHGAMDVGDTYAEVDLTNQKAYFIKNGSVVLESPVVTGNPNRGNATPQGTYTLTYKTRNAVLRGEKKPDGTYSYESPVKYWMPFNRGIGFHDAPWQASFGGSRYKTHGSHGCVNMPSEKAAKMYEFISQGIPVVCHY